MLRQTTAQAVRASTLKRFWTLCTPLILVVLLAAGGMLAWRWRHGVRLPGLVPPPAPAEERDNRPVTGFDLQARVESIDGAPRVRLVWNEEPSAAETVVYRSTRPLDQTRLNLVRYPIRAVRAVGGTYVDDGVADNTRLFYQVAMRMQGAWRCSGIAAVDIPDRPLRRLSSPSIRIEKTRYVLEVLDDGRVAKRYPIALGRNPMRRKLHQDNASTPEGVYRIAGCQPSATFYRAYDLDYPNDVDQLRYEVARSAGRLPDTEVPIGGEIQIHGKGIDANWTYGCIALRNSDMDQLFSHPEIGTGTPVIVTGAEMGADDLALIARVRKSPDEIRQVQMRLQVLGFYTGPVNGELREAALRALGAFQLARGLPLTCDLDVRTLDALR